MSLIEEKLARLRKEADERALRQAGGGTPSPHVSEAAHTESPGVFDISKQRLSELVSHTGSFQSTIDSMKGVDFNNAPLASFMELAFVAAVNLRVSDIHFEPEESDVRIRYRVDGLLYDMVHLPKSFYGLLVSRIKLLGRMKLNADKPQDGRFTIRTPHKNIEIRASSTPSQYGETVVLRVLDPDALHISLEVLGMRPDDLAIIEEEIKAPNGMILNTGPTGSGKTTTLYAFLQKRQNPEIKIITIEDPIEYQLQGIEQTQVNPEGGYTFSNGLRALVRQDPDILLIGEIRDQETAEIALQAALTGHLVFSTIHANEAVGAIPRLLDMNIKETSIGPALNVIMGQRLVRKLCDVCKQPFVPSEALQKQLDAIGQALPSRVDRAGFGKLFSPKGCGECNAGYRGRVGIFELLQVNADIERLIEQRVSETDLRIFAVEHGMVTMQQDGVYKALHGITTVEEIIAATGSLIPT